MRQKATGSPACGMRHVAPLSLCEGLMPHGSPALTGEREAEDGGQAYKTADCLSEASFCRLA